MIVLKVNVLCVLALPRKGYAPISSNPNGEPSFFAASQRMKLQPRDIHLLWIPGGIETLQNAPDPANVLHAQFRPLSIFGEPAKCLAAKRTDHAICSMLPDIMSSDALRLLAGWRKLEILAGRRS